MRSLYAAHVGAGPAALGLPRNRIRLSTLTPAQKIAVLLDERADSVTVAIDMHLNPDQVAQVRRMHHYRSPLRRAVAIEMLEQAAIEDAEDSKGFGECERCGTEIRLSHKRVHQAGSRCVKQRARRSPVMQTDHPRGAA